MTQLVRMILISSLFGAVAAGGVWLAWDFGDRLRSSRNAWREKKRLKAEADALLKQAKEPAAAEKPIQVQSGEPRKK